MLPSATLYTLLLAPIFSAQDSNSFCLGVLKPPPPLTRLSPHLPLQQAASAEAKKVTPNSDCERVSYESPWGH